jgi:hypothetical protein
MFFSLHVKYSLNIKLEITKILSHYFTLSSRCSELRLRAVWCIGNDNSELTFKYGTFQQLSCQAGSFETSLPIYQIPEYYISEDRFHRSDNFTTHIHKTCMFFMSAQTENIEELFGPERMQRVQHNGELYHQQFEQILSELSK